MKGKAAIRDVGRVFDVPLKMLTNFQSQLFTKKKSLSKKPALKPILEERLTKSIQKFAIMQSFWKEQSGAMANTPRQLLFQPMIYEKAQREILSTETT